MPEFVTFEELRSFGEKPSAKQKIAEAKTLQGKTVFLSHSTKDDDLVPGVVEVLANHGGLVYADHDDPSLPGKDCLSIAAHLRTVITKCRRFILLATPRSKDSKWMPWELGLGDGIRGASNVAIFPSAEKAYDQAWSQQEYLGLYNRVVWGGLVGYEKKLWLVWNFRDNTASPLSDWLKKP